MATYMRTEQELIDHEVPCQYCGKLYTPAAGSPAKVLLASTFLINNWCCRDCYDAQAIVEQEKKEGNNG